jgi:hypothetical protein
MQRSGLVGCEIGSPTARGQMEVLQQLQEILMPSIVGPGDQKKSF